MNASPFPVRAVLALVVLGGALFVAMLWMIGAGLTGGSTNDGGGHAGGKGLNGYAALAALLERRGHPVRQLRSEAGFDHPGLLVLTPPHQADGDDVADAIARHRPRGPVLLVLPKWVAAKVPPGLPGSKARAGWVALEGAASPRWVDKVPQLGGLDLRIRPNVERQARWTGLALAGTLPQQTAVQSMSSGRIVPLVRDANGQALAGYLSDGGDYPALARAAGARREGVQGSAAFPVVVVAEPDLLDNYGVADRRRALLALALVEIARGGADQPVLFDLTLNGHGRGANLLTLAFTPPFLAATLCLILAALAAGWRAFLRFGPPRTGQRAIAFGKRALVANAAGLIRRSRRYHLIAAPFAEAARERLARALGLPRLADANATDRAVDRALAARAPGGPGFSATTARLRGARKPQDILQAAQELHALERTLTR